MNKELELLKELVVLMTKRIEGLEKAVDGLVEKERVASKEQLEADRNKYRELVEEIRFT